jgi:hypothetical protein
MKHRTRKKKLDSGTILKVAHDMYDRGERVTAITLFHELRKRGYLKQSDFNEYVMGGILRRILQSAWKFEE